MIEEINSPMDGEKYIKEHPDISLAIKVALQCPSFYIKPIAFEDIPKEIENTMNRALSKIYKNNPPKVKINMSDNMDIVCEACFNKN